MKRFPEKMVMAAIILSCGFVMHGEPSAQRAKAKRSSSAEGRNWIPYGSDAAAHLARGANSNGRRDLRAAR
jgi:hypothetical protein